MFSSSRLKFSLLSVQKKIIKEKKKYIILFEKAFKKNTILKIIQVIFKQYKHFMNYVNHSKVMILAKL